MPDSTALTVAMPIALAVMMLGLGLSLTVVDFKGVLRRPKAVVVALASQVLLLPAVCFGIVLLFDLPPALAVGLMLLAASPGGTVANLFSHLFNGDVALNITLTAINTFLALVTLPIVVYLSLLYFESSGKVVAVPLDKLWHLFGVVLVPAVAGMGMRWRWPALARRLARPFRGLATLFLVAIFLVAVLGGGQALLPDIIRVGAAALLFNLVSLAVGYGLPQVVGLTPRQAIAISMEVGIHNGSLAIAIALSPQLLNNPTMAIPAVVYSGLAFVTAALFGGVVARRARRAGPAAPAG
jgi:bile acid:Na+ symporter, BASS family